MLKRIGFSLLYAVVWLVVSLILQKVSGNPNWIDYSVIGAIGALFGAFMGYGFGKDQQD